MKADSMDTFMSVGVHWAKILYDICGLLLQERVLSRDDRRTVQTMMSIFCKYNLRRAWQKSRRQQGPQTEMGQENSGLDTEMEKYVLCSVQEENLF